MAFDMDFAILKEHEVKYQSKSNPASLDKVSSRLEESALLTGAFLPVLDHGVSEPFSIA
jgi:hypothetical protein